MKQVLLPILAAVAFIVIVGLLTQGLRTGKIGIPSQYDLAPMPKLLVTIEDINIPIELADDPEERILGLSGRESLEAESGLLFVFEDQNVRPKFWMKDMNFAIDIIWIDDNIIVQIDSAVEPEEDGTPDSQLKLYIPNQEIDYVLEVNSGFSENNEIEIGNTVDLSEAI